MATASLILPRLTRQPAFEEAARLFVNGFELLIARFPLKRSVRNLTVDVFASESIFGSRRLTSLELR